MNNANVTIGGALNGDAMVFSDLDGTLLDHDGYSFEAAKPALAALAERAIPVVPSTSKTLVELETLSVEIGLSGAAIAENGAAIRFADGTIDRAVSRADIFAALSDLPNSISSCMECFCDMSIERLVALTGLDRPSAEAAAAREASEPFLWHGDAAGMADLTARLAAHDLQVTQGGRFFHIVPPRDKAAAMQTMLARFDAPPQSWALGDGPNDVSMLLAADRGALIANRHLGTQSLLPGDHRLYLSRREGAAGWCDAIAVFLAA